MINVEWLENGLYNIIKRAVLVVAGAMKAVTGSLLKNGSFVRAMSFRITTFFRHHVERSGDRTVLDECDEATNGKVKREIKNQRHSFVDCKEVPTTFTEEERKIILAHKKAVEAGEEMYIDPATGYQVYTEKTLLKNNECCGFGCRHCPYGHMNVPKHLRTRKFNSMFYT